MNKMKKRGFDETKVKGMVETEDQKELEVLDCLIRKRALLNKDKIKGSNQNKEQWPKIITEGQLPC